MTQIKFDIYKSNKHYRIGDIILRKGLRFEHDEHVILNDKAFNNSMLKTYLTTSTPNRLRNTIDYHSKNIPPNEQTLYINMRLGDVVMTNNGEIGHPNCYGRSNKTFLYDAKKLVKLVTQHIEKHNTINNLCIVSALHFGDNELHDAWKFDQLAVDENYRLLSPIIDKLKHVTNLPVSKLNSKNDNIQTIDYHFITLCTATHVIIDNTHFGEVINKVRTIYNR